MKRLLHAALIMVFALLFANTSKASHVMGCDIQWKCLGSDTFEITMKVYRDCNGVQLSSTPMQFQSDSCSSSQSFSQGVGSATIKDITPVCSNQASRCSGGSYPYGIEEHTFVFKVYLGGARAACCWWRLTWGQCCRNGAITTGYGNADFTTTSWLNRCITPCDNGPKFTNIPIAIKCAGQDVAFNHGVIDDDGDSLSYALVNPLGGGSYSSPYSASYPLTTLGGNNPNPNSNPPTGFNLSPITGDLLFRPMQIQVTVLKIQVTEWRKINGVYKVIGITNRDMQFIIVGNCNNKLPTLTGPFTWEACANQQICFTINSNDQDLGPPADSTKLSWNRGIPAGTFTTNNGQVRLASGVFCWTPTDDDVSTLPYFFTVTAADNHCPLNGSVTRSYSITVNPSPKATRTYTKLGCGLFQFKDSLHASYINPTLRWTVMGPNNNYFGISAIHQFTQGGKYVIRNTITAKGCQTTYYDTLIVDTMVQITCMPDTFVCYGKSLTITTSLKNGNAPFRYKWDTGDPADTNSTLTPTLTAATWFKVTVMDRDSCFNTDSIYVGVKPLPTVGPFNDERLCNGENLRVDAGNPGAQYIWKKDGSVFSTNKIVFLTDSGQYSIQIIDSFGCEAFDTFDLFVNDPVIVGPVQDMNICYGDTATLTASGADTYEWTDGTNTYTGATIKVRPLTTTTYYITGTYTYGNKPCLGYDTVTVNVIQQPTFDFNPLPPERCVNGGPLPLFVKTYSGGVLVTPTFSNWYCTKVPSAIAPTTSIFDPAATAPTGGTFWVTFEATYNGCTGKDSVQVTINPLPLVDAGRKKVFCVNAGNYLLDTTAFPFDSKDGEFSIFSSGTPAGALITTPAFPGNSYYFNATNAGVGTHYLKYKYKDQNTKCENWDTVEFEVNPIPVVDAGTLAAVCVNSGNVDLNAKSGNSPAGGTWTGPGIDPTGNFFNPTINTTSTPQTYWLKYTYTAIGCTDFDSVSILVNPIPTVTLGASKYNVCITDAPVTLVGTPAGAGGTYTGKGVSGNTFIPSVADTGTHTITFTYLDPVTNCDNNTSINIYVEPAPHVFINPTADLCEKTAIDSGIVVSGGANYNFGLNWTAGDGTFINGTSATDKNIVYRPGVTDQLNGSVTFKLTSTGSTYCTPHDTSITVVMFPTPSVAFTAPDTIGCAPLTVDFTGITDAPAGATFFWDFGDPMSGTDNTSTLETPSHIYNEPGIYSVQLTVKSKEGCDMTFTKTQLIEVYPKPKADFEFSPGAPLYTTVALPKYKFTDKSTSGTGIKSWEWSFGDKANSKSFDQNPEFNYGNQDTGWFDVTLKIVAAKGDCEDIITKKVRIGPDLSVFIPNAFSPDDNGPTRNDRFYVYVDGHKEFNIKIFDRWGEQLYESFNATEGWDGTYKGLPCQQDVYIYKVTVTSFADEPYEYYGTITLLR